MKLIWFSISLITVACGGGNSTPGLDATKADGPAPADASPAAMTIHGTGTVQYVTTGAIDDRLIDFTNVALTSYTPIGGGFDRHTGSGTSTGTFSVPVDQGATTWDLEVGVGANAPFYLLGHSTAPDLGSFRLGRKDQAFPTMSTPVTLGATGLTAWGDQDDLEIFSANAGAIAFSPQGQFGTALAAGATSFTTQAVDWASFGTPLIDSTQGDTTVMYQLTTQASGNDGYAALSKLGSLSNLTLGDGQAASANFALTAVPQDRSLPISWKRSLFDALSAEGGPGAGSPTTLLFVDALPAATMRGVFSTSAPDLVEFENPPAGTTDLAETFTYGNPFATGDTAWDEYVVVVYQFTVNVQAAGAAAAPVGVGYYGLVPVASLGNGGTIAPAISGVTGIEVGGMDVTSTAQTGVGTTPMVTWTAPATGTAADYVLVISAVAGSGGATTVTPVAQFTSSGTAFMVPPGTLTAGTSYMIQINAVASTTADYTAAPFMGGLPYAAFTTVTAQFSP